LQTGADINCGAALARIGAVTLDTNTIVSNDDTAACGFSIPPAGTVLPTTATGNERSVAAAIDSFVAGGGTLPLAFQVLSSGILSPTDLAAAFSQLSGEAATGVGPSGIGGMNSFLSVVLNSGFDSARSGPGVVTAPAESTVPTPSPLPGRGTVKALDYGPEDSPNRVGSIFASFDKAPFNPRR
jgi:hypothetical protein